MVYAVSSAWEFPLSLPSGTCAQLPAPLVGYTLTDASLYRYS